MKQKKENLEDFRVGYRDYEEPVYRVLYVAETPVKGSDWSYTNRSDQAMKLSPYWQKRFRAHMRRCNGVAKFI
jgi:hypothetical protein